MRFSLGGRSGRTPLPLCCYPEPRSPVHTGLPSSRPPQDGGGVAAGAEVGRGFEPMEWLDGGCGEAGAEDGGPEDGAGSDGLAGTVDGCGALGGEDGAEGEDGGLGADGEDGGFEEDFGGGLDDDFGGGFEHDLDGGEEGEAGDDDPDGEDGDFDADDGAGVQGVPFPVAHGVGGGVVVGRETFPLGVGGFCGGRVQWSLSTASPR